MIRGILAKSPLIGLSTSHKISVGALTGGGGGGGAKVECC